MAREIPAGWPGSQIYIHYHEENARAAAGSFGTTLHEIRQNAVQSIMRQTSARFSESVFSGANPAKIKEFDNQITNIEEAIQDTAAVTDLLQQLLGNAVSDGLTGTFAQDVSHKVATMIGGVGSASMGQLTQQITELIELYYGTNLRSLIQMPKNSPVKITNEQLMNFRKLQNFLNGKLELSVRDRRNLLVEIFTEQGLPDFLKACTQRTKEAMDDLIQDSLHLGTTRIQGSPAQAKPDISITFQLPGIKKTITQGISVKSNYFGMAANVLSTTLRASLLRCGDDLYRQANAASLMNADWLGRWFIWANLDRALEGSMSALQSVYNLQDRADMLLEFTADGFQIYNLNDIMYRLAQKVSSLGEKDLGKLGFGMRQSYSALKPYDRSKFSVHTPDVIRERAEYSQTWLTQSHIIVADVNKLVTALRA